MKIEYPQIDWQKIAKECPKAASKFYIDVFNGFTYWHDHPEELIPAKAFKDLWDEKPYDIIVWMHSVGVIAYAQPVQEWRPVCNGFVIPTTGSSPNGLTYQENLAVAIEKGFEVVERNINRAFFLAELRSGKYKKGCVKSDKKGKPIIKTKKDNDGYCSCAVMVHLFGGAKFSLPNAVKALGITPKDCTYIQKYINDTDLNFTQQADRIEKEVFR